MDAGNAYYPTDDPVFSSEMFLVYYQPLYNHSTGMLVGAEALVRWAHPQKGILCPACFIPDFEKSGLITQVDLFVFETVCAFLRRCIDEKVNIIPISVNISRKELFAPRFIETLEEIRRKYDVPVRYLRLELTESVAQGSIEQLISFLGRLHSMGYQVEMDDFGSGYSSLNVLKNVDFDMIKLDLRFLGGKLTNGKVGVIISSVVRMCQWLGLPVIAEGVEDKQQADFLKSIGCDYVQGFLYASAMPEEVFFTMLRGSPTDRVKPQLSLIDSFQADAFWSPKSMESLIFNEFVGPAALLEYTEGKLYILRVNEKFLRELGMNTDEKEVIMGNAASTLDESNWKIYAETLERAAKTGREEECETWRTIRSASCGEDSVCIRSAVRLIGQSPTSRLFFVTIRNITNEKRSLLDMEALERRFMAASEQANIYYWEYDVASREMRPCFRCMRDLGLPSLMTDYPDSAIKIGIFPPEVADMYRDWHRQIAAGVKHLEAVIPLTVGRIPFHVRYTTEFDEMGRPVKAYGSATPIVNQ